MVVLIKKACKKNQNFSFNFLRALSSILVVVHASFLASICNTPSCHFELMLCHLEFLQIQSLLNVLYLGGVHES
ncbi:hypothetical protein F5878DRAFT_632878 [Lentinula raphanica]|uniref:Uncharacterized protein n=1 Tax=Lentinula raphanica TaxID=153919 RepID=A0AA38NZ79_9AGAR|nr:hypothetical protein F5878DRAFT_632878 [Lentinula raphanica]